MSGGLRNKRPARFVTVEESARRRKEGRHSDLPLFLYLSMPCH